MDRNGLKNLLKRYSNGKCSESERARIEAWYNQLGKDFQPDISEDEIERDLQAILAALPKPVPTHTIWPRIAAAVILIVLSAGAYLYIYNNSFNPPRVTVAKENKVINRINRNKAVLTLADGSEVFLDNMTNGKIVRQGNMRITKSEDKKLVYSALLGQEQALLGFNTISTPKGGQYQVTLPDGTQVWLNAVSSLKYPVAFTGKERRVELSGEAYFEVAKNRNMPFIVKTKNQTIEVLGTHFNVNGYPDDEDTKTTLLEGVVKVSQHNNTVILQPGQQAKVYDNEKEIKIAKVDADEIVAWRNGYFVFEDATIQYIMKHLARWYDIDVAYKGEVTDQKFWGSFKKVENVNELLTSLETYGNVQFKITGRRVVVMP